MNFFATILFFLCVAGCAAGKPVGSFERPTLNTERRMMGNAEPESVIAPAGLRVSWPASAAAGVVYEVQHAQDLRTWTVFAYTNETNIQTDPALPTDFFRVRAVQNNGFHSSECSDWGHN